MFEKEWLLTCAPIGILEQSKASWKAIASGVFIYDNPFIWYVTSFQQISALSNSSLHLLLRHRKMSHILFDITSMHKKEQIDWIFDEQNDIAATLFPADPNFELKAIGFEYFLATQEMLPAMNCYSISYPYVLAEQDTKKVAAGVLEGIISRIDGPSKVFVTTPIYPDNYGCPLLVWKNPIASDGSVNLGNKSLYLGGIMIKSISLDDKADNYGRYINLGVMSTSELIKNLLFTHKSLFQKEKIKKKNEIRASS